MSREATQAQQQTSTSHPLTRGGILQRKCESCGQHAIAGGECTSCAKKGSLQRKLMIGASNDPLELEADRIADQVMAAPAHSVVGSVPPRIQRFTGQMTEGTTTAPASVDRVLSSPGRPLSQELHQDMGQRFGYDFSQVRIHTNTEAGRSARDVNAHAYTVGKNIVFGEGQFAPETQHGQRLLAHELTHVLQQSERSSTHSQMDSKRHARDISQNRRLKLQRDAIELGVQFNRALMVSDWELAVRSLTEMNDTDAQSALSALQIRARVQLRRAAIRLNPSPDNHVVLLIDSIARESVTQAPRPTPSPSAIETQTSDIASLGNIEKLSRAWQYASERLGPDVRREIAHLFSRESIVAMAAFATLYIASQLTPAGWVADALVLTLLTITVIFVGMLAIEVARDIWRFFAAVNATSEADLQAAGAALSRAIARGGVALFIALLSKALPRVGPRGGSSGSTATAEAVTAGPGGFRVRVPVRQVQEVPASIPRHLQGISYAVMVPPPGGSGSGSQDSASTQSSVGGGNSSQSGGSRGPEIWDELSQELGLEAPGTGASRGGGVRGAIEDARAGGLTSTTDLALQSHGSASTARGTLGVTGAEAESAHIAPTAAVRGVSGYSRSSALTTLLDPATHAAFDAHWKNWAITQRRAGRVSCSVAELERVMLDAVDQTPGLTQRVKNTLAWRLQLELRELGLRPDSTVELPYRNIGPSSGP